MTPVPQRVAVGRGSRLCTGPVGEGVGTHSITRGGAGEAHRQKLVAQQAQVPFPQGPGAQQHPAVPAEMPAFLQHQHHPGERAAMAQGRCP